MIKKDHSPRSIRVRISGCLALLFFLSFLISLIISIVTSKTENDKTTYSIPALAINFISFALFLLFLILFLFFFFYRFAKRVNGPALELKERESFEDDYQEGALIDKVKFSPIDFQSAFLYVLFISRRSFLIGVLLFVESLTLGLIFYFTNFNVIASYVLFSRAAIIMVFGLLTLILSATSKKKSYNREPKEILEIYQDKLILAQKEDYKEFYYSVARSSLVTNKGIAFTFFNQGEAFFFFSFSTLSESTSLFLKRKSMQIRKNK